MGFSKYDPAMQARPAWNAGKMVGTKRPLTQKQIWAVRFFLEREGRLRDRALFDLAIDSKLRGCDLVKIKIGDLVSGAEIRTRTIVIQQKTGRPVQFELTADVRVMLHAGQPLKRKKINSSGPDSSNSSIVTMSPSARSSAKSGSLSPGFAIVAGSKASSSLRR